MSDQTEITPGLAKTILEINDKRILKAVKEGKSLTKAQLATLTARAQGDSRNMPATVSTVAELADVLDTSRRTVARWIHEKGNPGHEANGAYNVAAWLEWKRQRRGEPEDGEGPTRKQKLAEEKDELEIRKLRVEIGVLERTSRPVEEIARHVHDMITAARYVILRLPQLAHHLYGRDLATIRATLDKEAKTILDTLSNNHWTKVVLQHLPPPTPAIAEAPESGPPLPPVEVRPAESLPDPQPAASPSTPATESPAVALPQPEPTPTAPDAEPPASSYARPQDFALAPPPPDVEPDAPRDPMQIYDADGKSIGIRGEQGPSGPPDAGAVGIPCPPDQNPDETAKA